MIELIRSIPPGSVVGYGDVGLMCNPRVSGQIIGSLLGRMVDGDALPWHRVLAKDGRIVIGKRDPHLAKVQAQRLSDEGVEFVAEFQVSQSSFYEF